jgi:hypothetical protein
LLCLDVPGRRWPLAGVCPEYVQKFGAPRGLVPGSPTQRLTVPPAALRSVATEPEGHDDDV